ncbi:MAG: T9SS type A sorting domain-containing protein [Candidatus Kapabacteria bacterium]|nr:T9SS type A sorting domain-containing protein [Candidatus Kapabacteria bacterium]
MKSIISLSLIAIFCAAVLLATQSGTNILRKEGAAPGHTGSPGDSLKNCTVCHGGEAKVKTGWIASDIPPTGYEPGKIYFISATNTETGATRLGFQVSPQDDKGNLLGTLLRTDTVGTQLVGNDKYITYTENGIAGVGTRTWKFGWKAPAKGTGTVVFYGAFNSNADNHKENDKTFISTLSVPEFGSAISGVTTTQEYTPLTVFPNPASNLLNISHLIPYGTEVELFDINGKSIMRATTPIVNISSVPPGKYFLRCNGATSDVIIDR